MGAAIMRQERYQQEITSPQNTVVKAAVELKQKKHRLRQGLFLAEGLRTAEEAVAAGAARSVFYVPEEYVADARLQRLLERAAEQGAELHAVSAAVMKKLADTETPQGVIAVCRLQEQELAGLLAQGRTLLVLDRVGDPGNVGTMLRTADAAGAGGVVLLAGCADVYAPKTVRSAMGSLFHVPVISGLSEEAFVRAARGAGYELLVTALDGAESLYRTGLQGRIALVMGSEAGGVSAGLLAQADKRVYIPMQGQAESLNVAVAAGVVLFEALRRRLQK